MERHAKTLYYLANLCQDGKVFYEHAAEQVNDPRLETTFKAMATMRENIIEDIKRHIETLDGDTSPKAHETMKGRAARYYSEILASISPDTEKTLIEHLEAAEERAFAEFSAAISGDLSEETKSRVRAHLATLKKSRDYMRDLNRVM